MKTSFDKGFELFTGRPGFIDPADLTSIEAERCRFGFERVFEAHRPIVPVRLEIEIGIVFHRLSVANPVF